MFRKLFDEQILHENSRFLLLSTEIVSFWNLFRKCFTYWKQLGTAILSGDLLLRYTWQHFEKYFKVAEKLQANSTTWSSPKKHCSVTFHINDQILESNLLNKKFKYRVIQMTV